MGIFAASSRSSANLVKKLLPIKARKIKEENNFIKHIKLGISRIPNNLINSSLILTESMRANVVHVAFFIQEKEGFTNQGIILDYGSYDYDKDDRIFFEYQEEGGLRYGYMEYNTFVKDSGTAALVNLRLDRSAPIRFNYLIDNLKKIGEWKKSSYSSITHNCQHFAVEVIKILKPEFDENGVFPGENATLIEGKKIEDIIPNVILNVLKELKNK